MRNLSPLDMEQRFIGKKCNITNGTHANIDENKGAYTEEVKKDGKITVVRYYVSKYKKVIIKRKNIILFILGL